MKFIGLVFVIVWERCLVIFRYIIGLVLLRFWRGGRGGFVNPWNVIGQALLRFALGQILTTKLVGFGVVKFWARWSR